MAAGQSRAIGRPRRVKNRNRALQTQKRRENIEIEALKTKTIRTGLGDKGKKKFAMDSFNIPYVQPVAARAAQTGPSDFQMQKWRGNIKIEAIKTKTIRTGLVDDGKKKV